ncbi:MAG: hypothetical protein ACJ74Y_04050 [Bryobacteraceae bacterium]
MAALTGPTAADLENARVASFEFGDKSPAIEQRNRTENSEATIQHSPRERNVPDLACYKRQWNDFDARNQTENNNPRIAHRFTVRPDEYDGNYQVRECKPIRSVGEKRIPGIRLPNSF